MKKYILVLITGLAILYSCENKNNNYFQNESKVVNEKISYNLKKINEKYMFNPELVRPYFEIAYYLMTNFDSLSYFIDQENETKVQNILLKLHNTVKSDSYLNSEYIKKIIIPNRFNKWIGNTAKSNILENKEVFKLDLLNLENELTSFLYNSIEADYYKFNQLQAMVVDSSDNIKVGDIYHANIFLAASNTTAHPSIMITDFSMPDSILLLDKPDNKQLFFIDAIDGKGIYKKKVKNAGKHGFKGVIKILNSKGEIEKFMFYKEFTVRK